MQNNKVKVSIIIPVYKVEKYIDVCLKSILEQTLRDIEVILVDDGSPDNCGKICDDYAKKDSRVKVIHQTNGRQGKARNNGALIARGEYI
ncbi:MAG: glycosyltransferase family 2 protein, partial [Alphaproteobacteria bacterium]